jgi:PEP-CTERM motif
MLQPSIRQPLLWVGFLLWATSVSVSHAESAAFTLVRAQTEIANPDPTMPGGVVLQNYGAEFASAGEPGWYAKARAGFGNSGAYAVTDGSDPNRWAFGETWWADSFTVADGVGPGELTIAVSLSGVLSGEGRANYALYISQQPFSYQVLTDWLDCTPQRDDCIPYPPANSQALIPMTLPASGQTVLTTKLAFKGDTPIYIASYFGVETWGVGRADFYGSAHFGITAPAGAALSTASGTLYPLASSIPEPQSVLLMGLGLLAVLGFGRRRHLLNEQ